MWDSRANFPELVGETAVKQSEFPQRSLGVNHEQQKINNGDNVLSDYGVSRDGGAKP